MEVIILETSLEHILKLNTPVVILDEHLVFVRTNDNEEKFRRLDYKDVQNGIQKIDDHFYSVSFSPIDSCFVAIFHEIEGDLLSEERKGKLKSDLLKILAINAEARDRDIERHLSRVQKITRKFLDEYEDKVERLDSTYKEQIVNGSVIHDVGKAIIPESILYKKGGLTQTEREMIKLHPDAGVEKLNEFKELVQDTLLDEQLDVAKNIVKYHHEKFNGTGYPKRLKGNSIPFEARVIAIVDVYEALTAKRSYKDEWTLEATTDYLLNEKGKHFDPKLVDVFVDMIETE